MAKHFNNFHPYYQGLILIGFRNATVHRDQQCESVVDEMLIAGLIAKQRKGYRICKGQELTSQEISQLKESGYYHDLFYAKDCVVPEYVKTAAALKLSVERWIEEVIEACFHPADTEAERKPILTNGKCLIATTGLVRKHGMNALSRMINCIPPHGVDAYKLTGKYDANGLDIYKSRLHSCGAESWNAAQPDFVAGNNVSKEFAMGNFLEGNTRRIVSKAVELGEQDDLGTWDIRRGLRINELAGHGMLHAVNHDPAADHSTSISLGTASKACTRDLHPDNGPARRARQPPAAHRAAAQGAGRRTASVGQATCSCGHGAARHQGVVADPHLHQPLAARGLLSAHRD